MASFCPENFFAAHCGELMTGDCGTSRLGRVYSYYTCINRRQKKCDKERARKEWIEDVIVHKLAEIANCNDVIDEFADRYMDWQDKQKSMSSELENRLKKVEAALQNNMSLVDSGFISESIKNHIMQLETERTQLEQGILKERLNSPKLTRQQVVYFLKSFRKGDINDISWRIYLVDTFLQAAYLYDNGNLILFLNFSGDNNKITLNIAEAAVVGGEQMCSAFACSCQPDRVRSNLVLWTLFLFL